MLNKFSIELYAKFEIDIETIELNDTSDTH